MGAKSCIEFKGVSKFFPGCLALNDVSFSIEKGEVHALIGENGAGKTTLINILHGVCNSSEGEILINNKKTVFASTHDAILYGIVKVHQEVNLIGEMTIAQNMMLGHEPRKGIFTDQKRMHKETHALLKKLKSNLNPADKISGLSVGDMQIIQIAKALYLNAEIICFDEPTSSLSNNEVEVLFDIIRELKEKGITIIFISHRLDEIFRIADRVTVLRDGCYINTFNMDGLTKEKMVQSMIGRDVSFYAKRQLPSRVDKGQIVLEVKKLSKAKTFSNISFHLHKGEILGFFGLVGAKRTDVMQCIFGADRPTEGEIFVYGKKVEISSPFDAIANSIGLIPENRKLHGYIENLTNADNIELPSLKKFTKMQLVNHNKKIEDSQKIIGMVGIKPPDPTVFTKSLSGGNQQKVIIAKWLATGVDIMIFDEPTKGIDVGAKTEIYRQMERLISEGKSIIVVSSELPEIMGISDRIIVMHEGKITAELERSQFNETDILMAALGGE